MEGIEQNSSFLDIRGLSRKMQLMIIAFYIYISGVILGRWAYTGRKERERVHRRERYFYVRGLSSVTPAVTDF